MSNHDVSPEEVAFEALTIRAAMDSAVDREDFVAAARLKKELASIQVPNTFATLDEQLDAAIAREDYVVGRLALFCTGPTSDA